MAASPDYRFAPALRASCQARVRDSGRRAKPDVEAGTREAMAEHLALLQAHGLPCPAPSDSIDVTVLDPAAGRPLARKHASMRTGGGTGRIITWPPYPCR
jgi:hypothetical protein